MATLAGAIQELVDQVAAVKGIHHAPDQPGEQIGSYPVAMIYATESVSRNEPADVIKDLHNPQIAVLMPLNDLALCAKTMLPLFELVVDKIFTHRNGRTSAHYVTFGDIQCSLGPIDWGGNLMYGWLFTLIDLKIINNT